MKESIIEKELVSALMMMYNDYTKNTFIKSLNQYSINSNLSYGWIRKIVKVGILKRINEGSKKNLMYKWNGGEPPAFEMLANRVLGPSKKDKELLSERFIKRSEGSLSTIDIIELTLILKRYSLTEEVIKLIIRDIQLYFNKNH